MKTTEPQWYVYPLVIIELIAAVSLLMHVVGRIVWMHCVMTGCPNWNPLWAWYYSSPLLIPIVASLFGIKGVVFSGKIYIIPQLIILTFGIIWFSLFLFRGEILERIDIFTISFLRSMSFIILPTCILLILKLKSQNAS